MKYRTAFFAAILLGCALPAFALKVVYDGCPRALGNNSPVPERDPVVVKCNGAAIYKTYMSKGSSFEIANDPSCHYIVEYARTAAKPTFGSLGADCSGYKLGDKVVHFTQTYKGCLCQFDKYR